MNSVVIHPVTKSQLDNYHLSPSHAVMLVGSRGIGKLTLANNMAATVLEIPVGGLSDHPYVLTLSSPDGKAIGIETVRELEHFLSLKVPSEANINRVVIIEDAHLLSTEAQNALLKTLEEPPVGTIIILNVSHEQALLATIRSRVQAISVKRPDQAQLDTHFLSLKHDPKDINQSYSISGGLPGLMHSMLEEDEHPLMVATAYARKLLSQSTYERMLSVDELSKNTELARDVVFIMQQMAHVSLMKAEGNASKRWQQILTASYEASEALNQSAQPKLALTKLMLNL